MLTECPPWEYSHLPNHSILQQRSANIVIGLRQSSDSSIDWVTDTRPIHAILFDDLTPLNFEYYAGHYRGEPYPCLRYCEVTVGGNPSIATPPSEVAGSMSRLGIDLQKAIPAFDSVFTKPFAQVPKQQRLAYVVVFASRAFVEFLSIHPYLNGNGHIARFLIWAILGRYGFWPVRWPIHPRPNDPLYIGLIDEYRRGNPSPLEEHVLKQIIG